MLIPQNIMIFIITHTLKKESFLAHNFIPIGLSLSCIKTEKTSLYYKLKYFSIFYLLHNIKKKKVRW